MGFYSKHVFPAFYDYVMDRPFLAEQRQQQLSRAVGEVLEIGVGTGLNLPHYPAEVRKITTVEPNPGMNKKLRRRIQACGLEVEQHILSGESLPFAAEHFDTVVSTLTLCSISQVETAMAELFRVLKPGGRLLLLEHGLSPDLKVARRQRRLDPLQRRFADGCTLLLNVQELVNSQPFAKVELDHFYLEQTPRTHGYVARGWAQK